jgi:hypothetical protein
VTNAEFCNQSTEKIYNVFRNKIFKWSCNSGSDPEAAREDMKANSAEYISCFSGWLETLCGFHTITNSGKEIDDICSKDW